MLNYGGTAIFPDRLSHAVTSCRGKKKKLAPLPLYKTERAHPSLAILLNCKLLLLYLTSLLLLYSLRFASYSMLAP